MAKRRAKGQTEAHKCIPSELGYYWATDTVNGKRQVVELGLDGFKHLRVFTTRYRTHNPQDFVDWKGPLKE